MGTSYTIEDHPDIENPDEAITNQDYDRERQALEDKLQESLDDALISYREKVAYLECKYGKDLEELDNRYGRAS